MIEVEIATLWVSHIAIFFIGMAVCNHIHRVINK